MATRCIILEGYDPLKHLDKGSLPLKLKNFLLDIQKGHKANLSILSSHILKVILKQKDHA
jgi:hypothetical protein